VIVEEGDNGVWHPGLSDDRPNSQFQFRPLHALERPDLQVQIIYASGDPARTVEHDLSNGCGEDAVAGSVKQLGAKVALQFLYRARQGRLGNSELLRGAGEVAMLLQSHGIVEQLDHQSVTSGRAELIASCSMRDVLHPFQVYIR
jgi:hypothetical protein